MKKIDKRSSGIKLRAGQIVEGADGNKYRLEGTEVLVEGRIEESSIISNVTKKILSQMRVRSVYSNFRVYDCNDVFVDIALLGEEITIQFQDSDMNGWGGIQYDNPGADYGFEDFVKVTFKSFPEVQDWDAGNPKHLAQEVAARIREWFIKKYKIEEEFDTPM